MKLFSLRLSALFAGLLLFCSCGEKKDPETDQGPSDNKPQSESPEDAEKAAVAAFKEQIKAKGISEALQKVETAAGTAEEDPAGMFQAVARLNEKTQELDSDGLPDDLKSATDMFKSAMEGMDTHIKAMPIPMKVIEKGTAGITAWAVEQATSDPEFQSKFGAKMGAWESKMTTMSAKMETQGDELEKVYKKYEIPVNFPKDKEEDEAPE